MRLIAIALLGLVMAGTADAAPREWDSCAVWTSAGQAPTTTGTGEAVGDPVIGGAVALDVDCISRQAVAGICTDPTDTGTCNTAYRIAPTGYVWDARAAELKSFTWTDGGLGMDGNCIVGQAQGRWEEVLSAPFMGSHVFALITNGSCQEVGTYAIQAFRFTGLKIGPAYTNYVQGCDTAGDVIVPDDEADLWTAINGLTDGQTLLIRGGTYAISGDERQLPGGSSEGNRITIANYGCQTVDINMTASDTTADNVDFFETDSYLTIRGLNFRCPGCSTTATIFKIDTGDEYVELIGNTIEGGWRDSMIVRGRSISRVIANHMKGGAQAGKSDGGHGIFIKEEDLGSTTYGPQLALRGNLFDLDFMTGYTGTADDIFAVAACSRVTIGQNIFRGGVSTVSYENWGDIKCEGVESTWFATAVHVEQNTIHSGVYLDAGEGGPLITGGDCIYDTGSGTPCTGAEAYPIGSEVVAKHIWRDNYLSGDAEGGAVSCGGGNRYCYAEFHNNVFDSQLSADPGGLSIATQGRQQDVVMAHNVFVDTAWQFSRGESCTVSPHENQAPRDATWANNLILRAHFEDRIANGPCGNVSQNNLFHDLIGTSDADFSSGFTETGKLTGAPVFVDAANGDYEQTPSSAGYQAGTDGFDVGLQYPGRLRLPDHVDPYLP